MLSSILGTLCADVYISTAIVDAIQRQTQIPSKVFAPDGNSACCLLLM